MTTSLRLFLAVAGAGALGVAALASSPAAIQRARYRDRAWPRAGTYKPSLLMSWACTHSINSSRGYKDSTRAI